MIHLLFVLSNWCSTLAGMILLQSYFGSVAEFTAYLTGRNKRLSRSGLAICSDLQIMVMIAAFVRVYWSFSPPAVWSEDAPWIQFLSISDVLSAPVLWVGIVIAIGCKQKLNGHIPTPFTWPVLTTAALVLCCVAHFVMPDRRHKSSFRNCRPRLRDKTESQVEAARPAAQRQPAQPLMILRVWHTLIRRAPSPPATPRS